MNKSLFGYIWQHTRRSQIWILCVILLSMPFTFISLELPKNIVNGPIQGHGFTDPGATMRLFAVSIPLPDWLGGPPALKVFDGMDFDRMGSLLALSAAFLSLVIINGLFKFYINTYKGRLGERTLEQLRYELFDRVLRFPIGEFRRVKSGEISTMIKDEVEPLGGFIGDAFVQPMFLGGQIATAIAFILIQNQLLALIAIGLLGVQLVVIPRLRRKQIELSRQRQITSRALAGRIAEAIDDIATIRTTDTANYQRADIAARLTAIFHIRFALYQWKYFIKFLNNLLAQITPFLFYLVGGYFAIKGRLDIGQLVAVIGAYKDLPSPVKELIDWDQQRLDVDVKYRQVIEQFSAEGIEPEGVNGVPEHAPFSGDLIVSNLTVSDYSGTNLLDHLSFRAGLHDVVAIVGPAKGGADTLAEVLARLTSPTSGTVQIAGHPMAEWPAAVLGREISYAGPDTYYPQSTIGEAALSGLRHGPPVETGARTPTIIDSGGLDLNIDGDWLNYAQAGVDGRDALIGRVAQVFKVVELDGDIVRLGLNLDLRLAGDPEPVEARILAARRDLRERLKAGDMAGLIDPFDPARYNRQSSVAENILFGTALNADFAPPHLAANPLLREVLEEAGLSIELFRMGREIAQTIVEVFNDLEADNPLFAKLALVSPDRLPDYAVALGRVGKTRYELVDAADRELFLDLALAYVEPRDRLGALKEPCEQRILAVREAFHARLGTEQSDIAFYDPDTYNVAATVQDNILLGRIAHDVPNADLRVQKVLGEIIDAHGLRDVIFRNGLEFDIGTGGKRLSTAQRQKLTMARALLRRSSLLIVHRTLSNLDLATQASITRNIAALTRGEGGWPPFGVLAFLSNPRLADQFERVIVLDDGKLVEDGKPSALRSNGGYLVKLVA